jgi:hypothetical protein
VTGCGGAAAGSPRPTLAALEADGLLARRRRHRWPLPGPSDLELLDSPARDRAAARRAADDPVLVTLMRTVGLPAPAHEDPPPTVAPVLGAVDAAVRELAAERHRRDTRRERAAADNVQRGY